MFRRYCTISPTIMALCWQPETDTGGVVIDVAQEGEQYGYIRSSKFSWGSGSGLLGNPGDYLIRRPDDTYYFLPKHLFEARFEESDDQSGVDS